MGDVSNPANAGKVGVSAAGGQPPGLVKLGSFRKLIRNLRTVAWCVCGRWPANTGGKLCTFCEVKARRADAASPPPSVKP